MKLKKSEDTTEVPISILPDGIECLSERPQVIVDLQAIVDPLLELLDNLGSRVGIEHDVQGGPYFVEVTDDWTAWSTRQFIGPDLPLALKAAAEAKKTALSPRRPRVAPVKPETEEDE